MDDLLSHIDDDYDSVNAEKGNRDKGNDVSTKLISFPLMDLREYHVTEKTWKQLNPPISEDDIKGKWYTCIFRGKCQDLFRGRALQ